jgi:hypothetical protein
MTHRFIVYQYGKVASTALTNALNKIDNVDAYQCHFMGLPAFQSILERLCQPDLDDYFYEHSKGQLLNNLDCLRFFNVRERSPDKLTIISLAREPFGWFKSAIRQEIEGHLSALTHALQANGIVAETSEDVVEKGLLLLLNRIRETVERVESVDDLTVEYRLQLNQQQTFADDKDFQDYLFLLGRFVMPHVWFKTQFAPQMAFSIETMAPFRDCGFIKSLSWGNVYLLRFEALQQAYTALLNHEGFTEHPELLAENEGHEKLYTDAIDKAFSSDAATWLAGHTHSSFSTFFGY